MLVFFWDGSYEKYQEQDILFHQMLPLFFLLVIQLVVLLHCIGSYECLFGYPKNIRISVLLLNLSRCQYVMRCTIWYQSLFGI